MKSKLILCLMLILSGSLFASEPDIDSPPQTGTHNWEYIQYPWHTNCPLFSIGWGSGGNERPDEMSRGLRMDILIVTEGMAFFKTNAIAARLYRADGEIVEPTALGKQLLNEPVINSTISPDGASPQVLTYFPWGPNVLEESWIEVTMGLDSYWVEIPYGFDRNPAERLAPSNTNGPPRFVSAMKSLTEHDHVVRWQAAHYDMGVLQNGWRLSLIQSNSEGVESQVVLDPQNVKFSTGTSWNATAWKTNSPATTLWVLDATGKIIDSHCVNVGLQYDGMGYTYVVARNGGDQRCWGQIEIGVAKKTYGVVVPSSLYKQAHGHARP